MQVEPQQRDAHPSEEDQSGSMNLPTSVEERINRDADFTTLRQSMRQRMKVIYIRGTGDPHQLADLVLSTIGHCLKLLEEHNVVVLDEDGCHTT
jgi:predicted nuclease of predicted toxin-antitoxin system